MGSADRQALWCSVPGLLGEKARHWSEHSGRWYCPYCGQVLNLFRGMVRFPEHVHWGDGRFDWCRADEYNIRDYLLERAP